MRFTVANNVNTTLAAPVLAGDLTITLASSANLPTLPPGSLMPVTMTDAASHTLFEIGYVSNIAGATLTLSRGEEGTSALPWAVGDIVSCNPTAATISNDIPGVRTVTATATLTIADSGIVYLDGSAGAMTVTVPASADGKAVEFNFERTDTTANAVTLAADGTDNISGVSSLKVAPGELLRIISDGVSTQTIQNRDNPFIKKLTAASSSITIESLGLLPGSSAEVEAYIIPVTGSPVLTVIINGDTTATNYWSAYTVDGGPSTKGNNSIIRALTLGDEMAIIMTVTPNSTTGRTAITIQSAYYVPGTQMDLVVGCVEYVTSATVTSIGIRDSAGSSYLAIGSTLRVKAK